MRNKARIISLLLVLMMFATVLTACAPKAEPAPAPAPAEQPAPAPEPAPAPAEPALVPEDVLKEAALNLLNNIPDNNFIMASDAALALAEENPDAVLWVDLRSAEDYAKGHITNSVNIPWATLGENLEVLPMNKQIIFQCYSGQTSAQATALAQMLGFNAVSFRGGMNFGWAPLNLGEDSLQMDANPLPAAKAPDLDEKEQIIWDAVVAYFPPEKNNIIAPADLLALVEENPDAITVLDIRSAEDYAKGHIETSKNIPFKTVGANTDQIPMNRPVYVTCYTGQTAGITIAPLRIMGYNAISLNRGMTGWDGEALPTVTE